MARIISDGATPRPIRRAVALALTISVLAAPPVAGLRTDISLDTPAKALVTRSGVVVAVRAKTTGGYIVTTPCGNLGYTTGGTPVQSVSVVLDPGHGGPIDTGAVSYAGLTEKDLNLRVASAAQRSLQRRGISVLLTRTDDYATPLSVRSSLADAVEAEVLVSVHHNAPTPQQSPGPGTEVFVQSGKPDSRRLGGLVHQYSVAALSIFSGVQWHAAPDAGALEVLSTRGYDTYGMLRLPATTAVLAELAYISSPDEARLLASGFYADIAGRALADAIVAYLSTDEPGSGFIATPRVFNAQPSVSAALCAEVDLG